MRRLIYDVTRLGLATSLIAITLGIAPQKAWSDFTEDSCEAWANKCEAVGGFQIQKPEERSEKRAPACSVSNNFATCVVLYDKDTFGDTGRALQAQCTASGNFLSIKLIPGSSGPAAAAFVCGKNRF